MPTRETAPPLPPGRAGPQRREAVASALDTCSRCGGPLCAECLLEHCPDCDGALGDGTLDPFAVINLSH